MQYLKIIITALLINGLALHAATRSEPKILPPSTTNEPLKEAIKVGDYNGMAEALRMGANANAFILLNKTNWIRNARKSAKARLLGERKPIHQHKNRTTTEYAMPILHYAIIWHHDPKIVQLLLDHGADVSSKGQVGIDEIIRPTALISDDSKTKIRTNITPLMLASYFDKTGDIIRPLLKQGADQTTVDSEGQSAFDYALHAKNILAQELLKKPTKLLGSSTPLSRLSLEEELKIEKAPTIDKDSYIRKLEEDIINLHKQNSLLQDQLNISKGEVKILKDRLQEYEPGA